ncbi:MAG: hypothetical protein AB2693_32195, partial [Candidatus Thiodiazotropha sp.]
LPRNSVVRLTDRPDMTLAVEWDVKQQNNNNFKQNGSNARLHASPLKTITLSYTSIAQPANVE